MASEMSNFVRIVWGMFGCIFATADKLQAPEWSDGITCRVAVIHLGSRRRVSWLSPQTECPSASYNGPQRGWTCRRHSRDA
jgi:hypothetical protein